MRVSDDLKQLALLFVMNGEYDKALPLLHQRLVIHEKFGPGIIRQTVYHKRQRGLDVLSELVCPAVWWTQTT